MGKFTFLIAFMLAFFTAGYGQVSGYSFSQSTGNTYTEITGGTVIETCPDCTTSYDSSSWVITLPTPVYFNGAMVSSVVMRSDGSLVMGSTTTSSSTGPIAATTTATGVISPLGMDLRSSSVPGTTYEIRWEDTGSSYVFQWKNASRWSQNTVEKLNFQVRINKATGVITMAYGEMVVAANTTYQPQVGLRGTTNLDYNNRRLTATFPDATPSWEDTGIGSSNSNSVLFTSGSPAAFPASGLNFTWSPPSCVPPAALALGSVGSDTATIIWQSLLGVPASGYDYYVSTSSTAPTVATTPTGNQPSGTSLTLTTLTPSTQYYVFIRANCGGSSSSWSSAVAFTTTQIPGVIPFIENFEGANNWGIANGTQTNKFFIGNFIANGGANSLYVSNNATGSNNDYSHTTSTVHAYRDIVIPLGTTDVIVSFDWRGLGEDGFDFLRLSVVPTAFIPAAGTQITAANSGGLILADNLQGTSAFNTFTGSFNAAQYAGQTVRLVFSWRNDSGDGGNPAGAIDNVNISIPTCLIPSGLQAASAAGDVTLNWSIAGGAPSGGYDIFVSGTNTAPSAGTAATHTSPTNTITISNLTGDAVYYYWVRSNCGVDGLSIWSFGGSFRLDCAAVVPPTTLETFTAYGSTLPAPDCWREASGALTTTPVALTGTTSLWTGENFNNSTTSDNGKAARVELYATRNDWMISPAYNLGTGPVTYQLEYTASVIPWSGSTTVTNMGEKYVKVVISTDGGLTWSDANVVKTYNNDNIPSTPQMEYISLAGYTGIVKIGFYGHSTTTTQDLRFYIDNFRIIETPSCLNPLSLSIDAVTIGESSGAITWNAPSVAPSNGYQYYVSTTDTDPETTTAASGSVGAGITTANVSSLLPSTNYYIWVRSNCGSSVSEWIGPVSFRTKCDAFDILTIDATPVCGQGSSTLTATSTGGTIRWFANQNGPAVATGGTFTTPLLTEGATYYVATADIQASVNGGARVAPASTDGTTPSTYGLVFDVNEDVTLHSVDVYLRGTAGTLSMVLQNSAGAALKTLSVALPAGNTTTPVQHTVNLGFEIPAGTGYRLLALSGPSLVRESGLGGFPYALGNLGQVTNGYISGTSTAYYYFYNWHLEALCSGPKVAVPVTVTSAPAFALSAAPAAICEGQTTALVTITEGASDYDTYVWTPSTGVTGNAATGWTFNPAVTTTYTLQASQSTGAMCNANPATVVITVNPLPTVVSVDNITACANTTTPIAVTGGTFTTTAKIGSGSATNTLSTPFKGNWGGTKTQAIYTVAELTALGMQPGDAIKSIGYVIQSGTPSALNDFTINIGLTSQTSVATFINDATTQVFYSAAYTATGVPGTVTFNVDQLVWDGTSNLLVETCFNNVTSGSGSASSLSVESSTAATGLNSYRSQDNNATVCTNTTAPTASTNRPNLVVGYAKSGSLTWSPATNLYTDATALVPYVAGANAPVVYFKSATNGTTSYTVTSTLATGCSVLDTFDVNVIATPAVTASDITVCGGATVAALTTVATGDNLKWYDVATGGTALASTAVLTAGTYYVTQTQNGCESPRTSFAVTVNTVNTPTASALTFCNGTPTVANLTATGADLKWYSAETGGTALAGTDALATGTYYVSQTVNGCESARTSVAVTVNVSAAPATQDAAFCNPVAALTIADLANNATGSGLKWYAEATATTELAATTALVTGTTYFVSQTINGCESPRSEVEVTINTTAAPATQDAVFCNPVSALTIADLANNATGTGLKWYADATATTELAATTALVTGTTYFVSQTINGCEGPRGEVEVTINIAAAPATQDAVFCNPVAALTVADLANNATGTGLKWYADATATTELAATTALVTGTTYFVSQTINGCEGPRGEVTVTITTVTAEEIADVTVCDSYVLPALTAGNYFTAANGGGTQLAAGAVIEENTEIFVFVQSGTCTAETSFTVTVNGAGAITGEALQTVGVHNLADATIADLEVTAAGTVTWYATEADALAGTDALAPDTQLVNGENYFAVSTVGTCTSAPFEVTVTVTLGKEDFAIQNINYYPNPVVDKLTVSYSSNITQVEVYNLLGQLVISEQPNATTAQVNMARLEAATYIVKVTADGKSKTFKVVRN